MDPEVIAIKVYSTFSKAPRLDPHHQIKFSVIYTERSCRCTRGVMVKALDCEIIISDFELQSFYYVQFRINTLW